MYPHAMTAVLSSRSRKVIRRNAAILPAYSLMLALLALLGFAAIANKTTVFGQDGTANAQLAVPHFFQQVFPSWFAGVCFAAIAIGALVPAAIMSIAAANLFTRNIYREFIKRDATPKHEAQVSKIVSLVVKFGALLFVLGLDQQNAINLQLLGGVWILQTILAIVAGLYTRWFHRWALLVGWAVGMVYGTVVAYQQKVPNAKIKLVDGQPVTTVDGMRHFGASIANFPFTHQKVYIAVTALLLNIIVAVVLTLVLRAIKAPAGVDATAADQYHSDAPDPQVLVTAERDRPAGVEPGRLIRRTGAATSTVRPPSGLALRRDRAAVRGHDRARDREAEPDAAAVIEPIAARPAERLEQPGHLLGRHARSAVGDRSGARARCAPRPSRRARCT